ncbi:MAG TPA: peptide-methionine (S)-S-oxide reductase MsrA [Candidatus Levybacteria bacterium]|nr:peptide-methionine (S)-S-oxide reductase MsrA [Candidatus Levybacteria bacterium]
MAQLQTATLAGGCFWCTEAIFKRLKGVENVISGYSGGARPNPTYEQVSSEATGHAEAIQIEFDPAIISYEKILEIFFHFHDPTTLNRQGSDEGTQYRSAVFYHTKEQEQIAEHVKQEITNEGKFKDAIVTEIVPFEAFYPAEEEHQNYYDTNTSKGYCNYIITPKIQKLLKEYSKEVKKEYLS